MNDQCLPEIPDLNCDFGDEVLLEKNTLEDNTATQQGNTEEPAANTVELPVADTPVVEISKVENSTAETSSVETPLVDEDLAISGPSEVTIETSTVKSETSLPVNTATALLSPGATPLDAFKSAVSFIL